MRRFAITYAVWLLAVVSLTLNPVRVHAQCCSPGNPIGGTGNIGALNSGESKLIVNYGYSYSGSYYAGSSPISPFFVETGYFNHARVGFSHGISDRWTIDAEATYFINKVQNYVDGIIPSRRKGYGLGDVSFVANYKLFGKRWRYWEVTSGVGLKIPVGTHEQRNEGALLPLDVQPTTGAVDFIHTLFLYKGYPAHGLRFFLTNRVVVRNENTEGYRYGNLYATSIFGSYNLGLRWDATLQLRSEIRGRDVRPEGEIPVTGSQRFFVTPQISYSLNQSLSLTALVDLPVYQYYNREQLANTFVVGIGVIKKFTPAPPVGIRGN